MRPTHVDTQKMFEANRVRKKQERNEEERKKKTQKKKKSNMENFFFFFFFDRNLSIMKNIENLMRNLIEF